MSRKPARFVITGAYTSDGPCECADGLRLGDVITIHGVYPVGRIASAAWNIRMWCSIRTAPVLFYLGNLWDAICGRYHEDWD